MNPKTPRPLGPSLLVAFVLLLLKTVFEVHLTMTTLNLSPQALAIGQVLQLAKQALFRELTLFGFGAYVALAYFPIWGAWKAGWFKPARRTTKAREYLHD